MMMLSNQNAHDSLIIQGYDSYYKSHYFYFIFKQQHRYTRCWCKMYQVDSSNCEEMAMEKIEFIPSGDQKIMFCF